MKKIIITISACLLFTVYSCDKEANSTNESIWGVWELRQASGMTTINYATGNGNGFQFTGNGYDQYTDSQLVKSGTFQVLPDATAAQNVCLVLADNQYRNRIVFDNKFDLLKQFIQVKNDSLFFISGCFANDGGSVLTYVKINQLIK